MSKRIRQTKIVFTIGPATSDKATLMELIERGVDVCRFNMAHASHDWFRETIAVLRECCETTGRRVATMMDVKGPEIRTRDIESPIDLAVGDFVEFSYQTKDDAPLSQPEQPNRYRIGVNYQQLTSEVQVGSLLLVDSGLIRLEITEVNKQNIVGKVLFAGQLGSRRHINLPGVKVNLPALTEKDHADIAVGVEEAVDFFALSFVREANDITQLRSLLLKQGSDANIIAKIEDQSGVRNLDQIIAVADGQMVARGDLGIEVPFEQLPVIQSEMVAASLKAGKPVIVATHMLESMIETPVPTRAEITDVANATRELSDCVMLSGETTVGKHPARCVDVLNRIIDATQDTRVNSLPATLQLTTPKEKILRSAARLAEDMGHVPIIVFTGSGDMARLLSALRPNNCPIFAFTDNERVLTKMLMLWGVEPFLVELHDNPETTISDAFKQLIEKGWIESGDPNCHRYKRAWI